MFSAPKNDLQLARELLSSGDQVSLAVLKKLKRHFWYLYEETIGYLFLFEEAIGFLFFDDSISLEGKRKMVQALVKPGPALPSKQVNLSDQHIKKDNFRLHHKKHKVFLTFWVF